MPGWRCGQIAIVIGLILQAVGIALAGASGSATSVEPCPECKTLLVSWEVSCHNCGSVVSLQAVPIVPAVKQEQEVLEEAFQNWLTQGKLDLKQGRYEEAVADFKEALKRVKGLEQAPEKEIDARKHLAEALEKAGKHAEAAYQCELLTQQLSDDELRKQHLEKADQLKKMAEDLALLAAAPVEEEFEPLGPDEHKFVPLYCAGCKRLFNEGVVFGFRRGRIATVRCFCGFEGKPLAKHDGVYRQAVREAMAYKRRRAALIEAASQSFPGGRNKIVAGVLALLLGNFGLHKWYLGERSACIVYFVFCWTFIPWILAFFEAIQYFTMSQVSWNLQYNVDCVLERVPPAPEEEPGPPHEVFSMEIKEDPEDFIDELSGPEYSGKRD